MQVGLCEHENGGEADGHLSRWWYVEYYFPPKAWSAELGRPVVEVGSPAADDGGGAPCRVSVETVVAQTGFDPSFGLPCVFVVAQFSVPVSREFVDLHYVSSPMAVKVEGTAAAVAQKIGEVLSAHAPPSHSVPSGSSAEAVLRSALGARGYADVDEYVKKEEFAERMIFCFNNNHH